MQSCYKKLSDVSTLSLKDTVYKKDALMHVRDVEEMVHWSQLCQGEKKMTEFVPRPVFRKHRYGINGVGQPPLHAPGAKLQQTSPGSLGAPAPPAHHELTEQHFSEARPPQRVLQLHCPSSHSILGLTSSGTECSSVPRSPRPGACRVRCLRCRPLLLS